MTSKQSLPARLCWGSLVGLASAAIGLAAAEVISNLSRVFQSPVLDVADRVVDGVPQSVKRLAIRWFGTNDKAALLIGITSLLVVYAAVVGVVVLGRRWIAAIAGIVMFGLAGAYASQTTRRAAPLVAVVPSVVGAAVAGVALIGLRHLATRRGDTGRTEEQAQPAQPSIAELTPSDRRRFLAAAGLIAVGAAVVGTGAHKVKTRSSAAASRRNLTLPSASRPIPSAPTAIGGRCSTVLHPEQRVLSYRHRHHGPTGLAGGLVAEDRRHGSAPADASF
jgi:hypothetical protein